MLRRDTCKWSQLSLACPCAPHRPLQTGIAAPLVTCSKRDTLQRAIELLAAAGGRAERLICVDDYRRVEGIVSLSDIFSYFNPDGNANSDGPTAAQPSIGMLQEQQPLVVASQSQSS